MATSAEVFMLLGQRVCWVCLGIDRLAGMQLRILRERGARCVPEHMPSIWQRGITSGHRGSRMATSLQRAGGRAEHSPAS